MKYVPQKHLNSLTLDSSTTVVVETPQTNAEAVEVTTVHMATEEVELGAVEEEHGDMEVVEAVHMTMAEHQILEAMEI